MKVIKKVSLIQENIDSLKKKGKKVGLVPTMGALHEGHLSLVRRARRENDVVVVSIFVNPTQFGPGEDFRKYPRAFSADCKLCKKERVDIIFNPTVKELYPGQVLTTVKVTGITDKLCGRLRPVHFGGVCTVVSKLFNAVNPDNAYFGQKDYQQFLVIKKMTADLNFRVKLRMCPIVREQDGLAMSSRNRYLSSGKRRQALCLSEALKRARFLIKKEKVSVSGKVIAEMRKIIKKQPDARIDYINICNPETLEDVKSIKGKVLVALAVKLGKTRLIDNDIIKKA